MFLCIKNNIDLHFSTVRQNLKQLHIMFPLCIVMLIQQVCPMFIPSLLLPLNLFQFQHHSHNQHDFLLLAPFRYQQISQVLKISLSQQISPVLKTSQIPQDLLNLYPSPNQLNLHFLVCSQSPLHFQDQLNS